MSRHTDDCKGNSLDDNCDGRCSVQQPIIVCPVHDTSFPTRTPKQWICRCSLKIAAHCADPELHPAGCDCGEDDGHCPYAAAGFINMCPTVRHNLDQRYYPFTDVNPPPAVWRTWRRYTEFTKQIEAGATVRHRAYECDDDNHKIGCQCPGRTTIVPDLTKFLEDDPAFAMGYNAPRDIKQRTVELTEDEYLRYLSGALNRCPPSCMCTKAHDTPYGPPPATARIQRRRDEILEEACRLISADREGTYGPAIDDFTRTGKMWAAILGLEEVTAEQVALCMTAVKMGRLCHTPNHADSWVDAAGYIALGGDIAGTPDRHM